MDTQKGRKGEGKETFIFPFPYTSTGKPLSKRRERREKKDKTTLFFSGAFQKKGGGKFCPFLLSCGSQGFTTTVEKEGKEKAGVYQSV